MGSEQLIRAGAGILGSGDLVWPKRQSVTKTDREESCLRQKSFPILSLIVALESASSRQRRQ